jgi:hypothetical protein
MSLSTKILPVTVWPEQADTISYHVHHESLANDYADIYWRLSNEAVSMLREGLLRMDGADYENWNTNKPYVKNWLLAKLGLTEDVAEITAEIATEPIVEVAPEATSSEQIDIESTVIAPVPAE